ncbi:MAG TPA: tetratricopeptide repeat protein [Sphingomicrobium sp.]|nr:tetratricopeptide repeat protein [Sphingomicrobium sp.]
MALTPDSPNDSFLREVDENLRRDRMEGFAKTYGVWIAAAVVLFLAAVGGWLYWQDQQRQQSAERSEELIAIYNDIGTGNLEQASKRLQPLQDADNDMVRALGLLTEAAIALEGNDAPAALEKYRIIAADESIAEVYRNLGLIRATALEFDSIEPAQVISRLQPLAEPGNPWFGSAGELTAMAYLKQGQKERAGRLFAAIAEDRQVPDTIRSRAVQIAGTLGIDASAALPQAGQSGSNE